MALVLKTIYGYYNFLFNEYKGKCCNTMYINNIFIIYQLNVFKEIIIYFAKFICKILIKKRLKGLHDKLSL